MGELVDLCLRDEWPGTIAYDGAQCMSRVRKHLDEQHCGSLTPCQCCCR